MSEAAPQGRFVGRPSRVVFGPGCLGELRAELDRIGAQRPLVITGRSLAADAPLQRRLRAQLRGRPLVVFDGTRPHVPRRCVMQALAAARASKADALISIGGSTAHDTAKAVAWGIAADIRSPEAFDAHTIRFTYGGATHVPSLAESPPPILAIPTTLSAGEFTDIAGLTDEDAGRKDLLQDAAIMPKLALLDPELTTATPSRLWSSTGIKAIDHCLEALLSVAAHPYTDGLALHAVAILFRDLAATARDGADLAARGRCQIAAWMSVAGLASVSLGLSHAIGHQLGAIAGVPHGETSCIVLPHVLAFNAPATRDKQARLARHLGFGTGDDEQDAEALGRELLALIRDRLALPWRLRDAGVALADLERIATATMTDALVATNPRPVDGAAEVVALLRRAW